MLRDRFLYEMDNINEILGVGYFSKAECWISELLSGTFSLGSRMFLVCFSFNLRSNLLQDGLEIALKQVH